MDRMIKSLLSYSKVLLKVSIIVFLLTSRLLICFYSLSKESPKVIQISDSSSDSEEANSDISLDESIDDKNDENVEAASVNCMTEALLRAECNKVCCSDKKSVYQPKDSKTLALFTNKNRKFLQAWYDKYKWITLCIAKKRVFCVNCRFAQAISC